MLLNSFFVCLLEQPEILVLFSIYHGALDFSITSEIIMLLIVLLEYVVLILKILNSIGPFFMLPIFISNFLFVGILN